MKRFKKPIVKQLIYESYDRLLKSWGTDFEEKDIETTFGRTHIMIAGDPALPPLLLFHKLSQGNKETRRQ